MKCILGNARRRALLRQIRERTRSNAADLIAQRAYQLRRTVDSLRLLGLYR